MKKSRIIIITVIATLVVVFTLGAVIKSKSKSPDKGVKVRIEEVSRGELIEFVSAPGEIEPKTKVEISAKVSARVVELPYQEGDLVTAGNPEATPPVPPAVLVKLDSKDLESQLRSAKANYSAKEAQIEVEKARIAGQKANLAGTGSSLKLAECDLKRNKGLLESQDISTIDFQRNEALPLVTVDYTYNINGLGATRNDSYDLLEDKRFEDHRIGLRLLVPLGNQAAKSRLRRALYQRRQDLATRERRAAVIEREVLNAIDQLEANWQRILASRQNTILADRLYNAEKRQFELGLRTSTDVLDEQANFADAQSNEISALAEYQIALVDIAFATGTLLGAAKVDWEPIVPHTYVK